jgi:hypothetical protein
LILVDASLSNLTAGFDPGGHFFCTQAIILSDKPRAGWQGKKSIVMKISCLDACNHPA